MSGRDKPLIVLVDDEPGFINLIARWLVPQYDVKTFDSGVGVYEAVVSLMPDLIILDAHMHPVDGYEVCRRIRADSRFDLVSVLFLTGAKSEEDLMRQIEAGGSGFLEKPIDREELCRVVAEELAS